MKRRFNLKARIIFLATALVLTTAGSCLISMWYTGRTEAMLSSVIERDFLAVQTAQQLNTALVMQKGFVTYFFLDGNPDWLNELAIWDASFTGYLDKAAVFGYEHETRSILSQIAAQYEHYTKLRRQVINLYRTGERDAGIKLHKDVRRQFFLLQELCAQFQQAHEKRIAAILERTRQRAHIMNSVALVSITGAFVFSALLVYLLLRQIIEPIRELIAATGRTVRSGHQGDEMKVLSSSIQNLLQDVDQTKTKLEKSHRHLMQSEKLAMVGRLAAGMAHSIRNPLTSVKMRLFSMERTLGLSGSSQEDFEVIAGEVDHIESIVRNFLEFSRPPKMKMQPLCPSDIVDRALQLLKHRIDAHGIEIRLQRTSRLPVIEVDQEQLQEVVMNIILNGCEAMGRNGVLSIGEQHTAADTGEALVGISISDTGPGIPLSEQDKVFQPFYSTKDEGTGLGLSIAARIVEEHGGWIDLASPEGAGATFTIVLPVRQKKNGDNPHR